MKTKSYKYGTSTFKAYQKKVGLGWEIGFTHKGKTLFIGNFVKSTEANKFWSIMNTQIRNFGKRYRVSSKTPASWYTKFLSNHINKHYYTFLTRLIPSHNRVYTRNVNADLRKFKRVRKTSKFSPKKDKTFLRAA